MGGRGGKGKGGKGKGRTPELKWPCWGSWMGERVRHVIEELAFRCMQ